MKKLSYWVLTYEERKHITESEMIFIEQTQSFLDLGEAEDARYCIEEGIFNKVDHAGMGTTFKYISLEPKECDLVEEG